MINIPVNINKHTLLIGTIGAQTQLPTGSVAVDAVVISRIYGDDWDGYNLTVQFWQDPGEIYEVEVENNIAVIPAEILAKPGIVYMAIYGTANDERISTNTARFEIEQGSYTEAAAPAPALSMFEKAVNAAVEAIIDNILSPGAVTNTELANMPAKTIKGNPGTGTAAPQDISQADFRAMFAYVGASSSKNGTAGFVPAATPSSMAKYLKGNGTWDDPLQGPITIDGNVSELGYLQAGDSAAKAFAMINKIIAELGNNKK